MDVQLTPDQQTFARRAVESGRLRSEQDAVEEALALCEERERQRAEFLLTLEGGRASLARGEGGSITVESVLQLAPDVKTRGLARLLRELSADSCGDRMICCGLAPCVSLGHLDCNHSHGRSTSGPSRSFQQHRPLRDRRGSASARLVDRAFRAARVSERTPMR
jgi:Arc/MetJ-type ribon-helix-helix transcriptional regulator